MCVCKIKPKTSENSKLIMMIFLVLATIIIIIQHHFPIHKHRGVNITHTHHMMKQPYRDIEPTIFTSIQLEQQQKIFSNKSTIHNELIFTISYHHHHDQKIVQMFNNNNLLFIKIMTNNIHPPSKKNITYSFPILLNN